MNGTSRPSDEQSLYWNGPGGHAWTELQVLLDRMFTPFTELLLQALPVDSRCVLDIGCGAGDTTFAAAEAIGRDGCAIGIDISAPLIEAAMARSPSDSSRTRFICADAAAYPFEPATFDALISRFGLMFFEEPVAAFNHLRHASRANAPLCFAAWRSPTENPFMTTAERAARPLLPALTDRDPNAPGQFAFADARRVRSILEQAGWGAIDVCAVDVRCTLPESDLVRFFTKLGPLGRALSGMNESERREVIGVVRAAFEPFVQGAEVRFTSACWIASARA